MKFRTLELLPSGGKVVFFICRFCHVVTYQLLTDFRIAGPSPRESTEIQGGSSREGETLTSIRGR
jgi:hypothetical protein